MHLQMILNLLTICWAAVSLAPAANGAMQKLSMYNCQQSVSGLNCEKAIDGIVTQMDVSTCVMPASSLNDYPWWQAQFSNNSRVRVINVANRVDSWYYQTRSNNELLFTVEGAICYYHVSTAPFNVKDFSCDVYGGNLMISAPKQGSMTLCEVTVSGEYADENIKFLPLTACEQSSSLQPESGCSKAIDGQWMNLEQSDWTSNPKCSHLAHEAGWWSAQTAHVSHFVMVRIINRYDCCQERLNDFTVSVDGSLCASHKSDTIFYEKSLDCDAIGRLLKVTSRVAFLTICEIQAFGESLSASATWPSHQPLDESCTAISDNSGSSVQVDVAAGTENNCKIQCSLHLNCRYFAFSQGRCRLSNSMSGMMFEIAPKKIPVRAAADPMRCREACVGARRFCIFQQRLDGSVRFNRPWDEYVNGFGDSNNFWAGLSWLNRMTSRSDAGVTLRVEVTYQNGRKETAEYSGFKVKSESTNYMMTYDQYLTDMSTYSIDQLASSKGRQFSTMDRDNDEFGGSCSNVYHGGSGWWFGLCTYVNPNGIMGETAANVGDEAKVFWGSSSGQNNEVKKIRLLIQKPE